MNSVGKSHINNKRIAKNTMLLYIRMLLTAAVAFYTSNVVLKVLGEDDFGVFEVVAGAVTMLAFLNGAMTTGTQRYLSIAIAKGDEAELNRTFSATLSIHIAIAIVIFIFAETFGLWFVNNVLKIPEQSMVAANWIYQFATLSFMITVTQVPYNAMIVSHERMGVFAYISIVEVILKLGVVLLLQYITVDKLTLYGGLLFVVTLFIGVLYRLYCFRNFPSSKYKFKWEPKIFKEMINYAGWNLWGTLAFGASRQGMVLLTNIFFGTAVNAAQALAYKVSITIAQFVGGFQMAMNPQLVKSYAVGHIDETLKLMKRGAKLSFLLMYLLIVPVIFNIHYILDLWLPVVPQYTAIFCQLTLVASLIDSFAGPLMATAQATGRIRLYQSVVGGVLLLNLPISYIFLKFGFSPPIISIVAIAISGVAFVVRLFVLKRVIPFSILSFFKQVMIRPIVVGLITLGAYFSVTMKLGTFFEFVQNVVIVELFAIILVVCIGVNRDERKFVYNKIKTVIKNKLS